MGELKPKVIVIGGPNGAGKSTCAPRLLRDHFGVMNFVNPDAIALGLSAFNPETVKFEAARILLERVRRLSVAKASFAFESTLAGRSYAVFLEKLLGAGYEFHLLYLWVQSVDIAVYRVAERVRRGGHAVPEADIRRRYSRSRANMLNLYAPLATTWAVFDNSVPPPVALSAGERGTVTQIRRTDLWDLFTRGQT